MKNNPSLYFDLWRKKDFKELIMAYTQTANLYHTKDEMRIGFAEMLDKYTTEGKISYSGTLKQWSSAYTLGRELGIFRKKVGEAYELSKLAQDFLESKIVGSEYLLNYLLNLNQIINSQIVHPLYEVLMVIERNNGYVSKNEMIDIDAFHLSVKTKTNRSQLVNILIKRMIEAEIIEKTSQKDIYSLTSKFTLDELLSNCNKSPKTYKEFEKMSHEDYVDMLSVPSPLVQRYKGVRKNNE